MCFHCLLFLSVCPSSLQRRSHHHIRIPRRHLEIRYFFSLLFSFVVVYLFEPTHSYDVSNISLTRSNKNTTFTMHIHERSRFVSLCSISFSPEDLFIFCVRFVSGAAWIELFVVSCIAIGVVSHIYAPSLSLQSESSAGYLLSLLFLLDK